MQAIPHSTEDTLPAPAELRRRLPLGTDGARSTRAAREAIRGIVHGRDRDRLVVVVGPCSIHDPRAALEYARALSKVATATQDALVLVMRTYFDKPRTTVGWKGLIRDPHLDGRGDLASGLGLARRLVCAISELGLPCGTELLDPLAVPYLHDALAWGAIGARTAESQTHRELAASLALPVGFKNSVQGNLEPALNALIAAREPESFAAPGDDGRLVVRRAQGNPDGHLILRGGVRPNYRPADVECALRAVGAGAEARPIMVDCSHGNSGGDPARQSAAFHSVLEQYASGQTGICGLMLESHLREGRQDPAAPGSLRYGVSITDACIGWEQTEQLLYGAAAAVRARRDAGGSR